MVLNLIKVKNIADPLFLIYGNRVRGFAREASCFDVVATTFESKRDTGGDVRIAK
jgi:hypothetical protein